MFPDRQETQTPLPPRRFSFALLFLQNRRGHTSWEKDEDDHDDREREHLTQAGPVVTYGTVNSNVDPAMVMSSPLDQDCYGAPDRARHRRTKTKHNRLLSFRKQGGKGKDEMQNSADGRDNDPLRLAVKSLGMTIDTRWVR